jgi:hypothetical protein
MNRNVVFGGLLAVSIGGCSVVSKFTGDEGLFSLGVIPQQGFSNSTSPDYGLVKLFVGKDDGSGLSSALSLLEIESDSSIISIEEVDDVKGNDVGDLLILVDGSGSLEQIGCEVCPSDPLRHRVEAVRVLTRALHECAPDWRVGLMEFGPRTTEQFSHTYILSDYTTNTDEITEMADGLISDGGTPLWDSLSESIRSMNEGINEKYSMSTNDFGKGIVIVSDGEDTDSLSDVHAVVALAREYQIPVSAIGLGGSSDVSEGYSISAVDELRLLAKETGGFYASVTSPSQLPELADQIASAYCGGYAEVHARFLTPPESGEIVSGTIKLKNTVFSTPFEFRAP